MRRAYWITIGLLAQAAIADAQLQQPTTVQLPTFSYFTVQTSVLVPDSGGAYLGGISRSQIGSRERGVPLAGKTPFLSPLARNRGIASTQTGGGMSVHATIINHEEIDAAVLDEALARRGLPANALEAVATTPRPAPSAAQSGASSLADIRREQAAAEADKLSAQEKEAREYFAKAAGYEQAGQAALAKNFYRMAAVRATGELKARSLTRIAALDAIKSPRFVSENR